MLKRTYSKRVSAGAMKKRCLDTAGESSSVDTESEHLFPDTESTHASTEAVNGNPTLDGEDLDIPDSLTLARVDRENQGPWEAEYSYGGEADLYQEYNTCLKNPGHRDFIPVDKFSIDDLPEGYRNTDIVDCIGSLTYLTVRVKVKYVSYRRPATDPNYGKRGQATVRVGTGWVYNTEINLDPQKTCECKDCRNSQTPETNFAVISITTAKHVVFDDLEAEHTTCHLFFDSGGTLGACSGVVTLTGMKSTSSNIETDQCYMEHFTHDLQLAYRLHETCLRKDALMSKLPEILPKITQQMRSLNVAEKQLLLLIVSHPHGCSKQISIGRLTSISFTKTGDLTYEYTAATCPGSSGALVVMPHKFKSVSLHEHLKYIPGAHAGVSKGQPGFNCFTAESLSDRMRMFFRITDLDIPDSLTLARVDRENQDLDIPNSLTLARVDRDNQGPWNTEYSYGEVTNLHRYYNNCTKNPGHRDFIPVEKFSIDDLPEGYRHTDIVDYIRALADLTVRVTVNYVSDRRQVTVPGTDKPYPGYDNRGQRRMKVGTGWVYDVKINLDPQKTCECKDCRNSQTPETKFAVISIATANHLVFDDLEAEHTTCHLFYDRGGTPDACSGVAILTGMKSKSSNIETDQHDMEHFTHDVGLGYRLVVTCTQRDDLMIKLREILPPITQNKWSLDVAEKQPLLFIVSHPHGCSKHISIGRWTSLSYAERGALTYEYTTATCPGSSGAIVVMPHDFTLAGSGENLIYIPGAHFGRSEEQPGVNYFKAERYKRCRSDNEIDRYFPTV